MARASDLIDGANAVVSVLGYMAADTAIGGAGTALSGAASLNNLRQRVFNRSPDIARPVEQSLTKALNTPTVHMPADGPQLLPQMFERIRITPQQVMAAARNPDRLAAAMLDSARGYDTENRPDLDRAFTGILTPILRELLADPQVADTLRPIYEGAVAETLEFIADQVSVLTEQFQQSVEELGLQKGLIIALAQRIAPQVDDIDAAHRELQRAIELATEAQQTGALSSNLSEAVTEVMTRVDALNAEGRVDEGMAELDRAMQEAEDRIAEAQAGKQKLIDKGLIQTRLTRDVAKATALLLDRLALEGGDFSVLRDVQEEWYERGRDKGLRFDLEVAISLARECQILAKTPDQRGSANNDLGNALAILGERESGKDKLSEAVNAYQKALEDRSRDKVPQDWAATQTNIGTVHVMIADRESCMTSLQVAIHAFRTALEELQPGQGTPKWAGTQNSLGAALLILGELEKSPAVLRDAIEALQHALSERLREDVPVDWAMTQNNLGLAFQNLGELEDDSDILSKAIHKYECALEVLIREEMPIHWAMAQENLAWTWQALGIRSVGTQAHGNLSKALAHVTDALEVYSLEASPFHFDKATQLRDTLTAQLDALASAG